MSIKTYFPSYYDEIREIDELVNAEDIELKIAFNTLDDVLNAFFIRRNSKNTIEEWEKQFNVNLNLKTFEEKKRELLSLMLGFSKLSCSRIEQITLTKTTYNSISFIENSKIFLEFSDIGYPDEQGMAEVLDYIEQLKPAHLGIEIILRFRTHGQMKDEEYSHEYLKKYTHAEIRERRQDL